MSEKDRQTMNDLILSYIKRTQEDIEMMQKDFSQQLNQLEKTNEELTYEIRRQSSRILRMERKYGKV